MPLTKNGVVLPRHRDFFERFFEDRPLLSRRPLLLWSDDGDDVRIEEYTEGSTLVVRAELAGIDPEKDVTITLVDGTLRLEVNKQEDEVTKDRDWVRREFRYGALTRELRLPSGVSDKDVTATYKDGILEVRVEMSTPEATSATIPITTI